MAKFLYVYHGGKAPSSPEEGQKVMQEWMAWCASLGDAVADSGNPLGMSKTVSPTGIADDGGANPVSGYSLVNAADIDTAVAMVQNCPMLADGGSVEVAECFDM
ncbi:MAG: hypothetical protein ACI8YI_001277 [Paracoccaceae bacterium]|jgi:hypothetical protein